MKIEHSPSTVPDYNALLLDGKKYHYRANAEEVAKDLIRLSETGVKIEGTVGRFFREYGMWPENQGILTSLPSSVDEVGYGTGADAN